MDRRLTFLALVALVVVPLSGCLSSQAPGAGGAGNATPGQASGPTSGLGGSQADTRAHVHDLWKGRDNITLFDSDVQMNATRTDLRGSGPLVERVGFNDCYGGTIDIAAWCLGRTRVSPPPSDNPDEPTVVAPGTEAMHVTASWQDPTITGVDVVAIAADGTTIWFGEFNQAGHTSTINASYWGKNRTTFPLGATDDGHATRSKWQFIVRASGGPFGGGFLALADGSVHLTVEVDRTTGDLPIEPPHPDWYANADTYHVGYGEASADNMYQVTWFQTDGAYVFLRPVNPIPPGTEEVLVQVNVTNDSPLRDEEQLRPEVRFEYRNGPFWWTDDQEVEPESRDGNVLTYRIPVAQTDTDSLYSCSGRNSTWSFNAYVRPHPAVEDEPVFGADVPGATHFAGKIEVRIAATQRTGAQWSDLTPTNPARVPGCDQVSMYYQSYG